MFNLDSCTAKLYFSSCTVFRPVYGSLIGKWDAPFHLFLKDKYLTFVISLATIQYEFYLLHCFSFHESTQYISWKVPTLLGLLNDNQTVRNVVANYLSVWFLGRIYKMAVRKGLWPQNLIPNMTNFLSFCIKHLMRTLKVKTCKQHSTREENCHYLNLFWMTNGLGIVWSL